MNQVLSADAEVNERSISSRVVEAVAAHRDVDPIELEPLYDAVDPDALDALFRGAGATGHSVVEFELDGCIVTVTGDGDVDVADGGE